MIRIVKMTFQPSEVATFRKVFEESNNRIRNFDGCSFLELYQDLHQENVFFTYSHWEDEAALNRYRHSDFFREVWGNTKKLFSEKPEAWSVERQ